MSKKQQPTARDIVLKIIRFGLIVLFAKENPKGFAQDVLQKRNDEKK